MPNVGFDGSCVVGFHLLRWDPLLQSQLMCSNGEALLLTVVLLLMLSNQQEMDSKAARVIAYRDGKEGLSYIMRGREETLRVYSQPN